MHTNRPRLGIYQLTLVLLIALPPNAILGDDASAPGVIQITDAPAAPAPVPIPVAVTKAPVSGGPSAADSPEIPRGPHVGNGVGAESVAPHAPSSCSVACQDCCPEGTCQYCCCESASEDCCSENDSEICCDDGKNEQCCCEQPPESGRIEPVAEEFSAGGTCKNCHPEELGYTRITTLTPHGLPVRHYQDESWEVVESEYKHQSHLSRWWDYQKAMFHTRAQYNREQLGRMCRDCLTGGRSFRCKCGYFIPSGCGGHGCPPFGCYSMVYPLNPHYVDDRDTGIYAAQGYGVPVTVPLAPNVEQTYNYSWGIPSSRLTHISRTVR